MTKPGASPDPGRNLMHIGPIKFVGVATSPSPGDQRVCTAVSHEAVPFEMIRHLCSQKPLGRFEPPGEQR